MKTESIIVYLTEAERMALQELCYRQDMDESQLIRQALRTYQCYSNGMLVLNPNHPTQQLRKLNAN